MNNKKFRIQKSSFFDAPELELPYFPFSYLKISKDWLWW